MNKRLIFFLKLTLTLAVLAFIAWEIYKDADKLRQFHFTLNWLLIAGSLASFAAFMLQSALVWRWLARRMGDRTPLASALGAYLFSQMGKYVPGKVALLLMRIERARRVGMDPQICVVATLLENAMYMISGALIAVLTLLIYARDNLLLAVPLALGVLALSAICHPRIFYALVNRLLTRMNRPAVAPAQRLRTPHLLLAVLGFLPCWLLGGLSLYLATSAITLTPLTSPAASTPIQNSELRIQNSLPASTSSIQNSKIQNQNLSLADYAKFPGIVALGVTGGMASILPGGMGAKELIQGIFLQPMIGKTWAILAVTLQRLIQVTTEVLLGLLGAAITNRKKTAATEPLSP